MKVIIIIITRTVNVCLEESNILNKSNNITIMNLMFEMFFWRCKFDDDDDDDRIDDKK